MLIAIRSFLAVEIAWLRARKAGDSRSYIGASGWGVKKLGGLAFFPCWILLFLFQRLHDNFTSIPATIRPCVDGAMTDGLGAAKRIPPASSDPDIPSQMLEKSGAEEVFSVVYRFLANQSCFHRREVGWRAS